MKIAGMKITYIGDWVFYTGPNFIESPFEMIAKDCQLRFLGKPVTDALQCAGAVTRAYSNWQLYHMTPDEFAEILSWSDVLIVSDVEARSFHLNPSFFDREAYGKEVMLFPDRLKRMRDAVERGLGLIYMGGWLGFSGHMEKGGWRRSPISDWLPFECLVGEDLVESSEGYHVECVRASHPAIAGLDTSAIPPLLGYNEFVPRKNMEVLWKIRETGHPLLGVSTHGRGRMVTYGSDPVPHWGINFMLWKDYARLWPQLAAWAAGR